MVSHHADGTKRMTAIAILEDQKLFRDALEILLQHHGFTVSCATSEPSELLASVRTRAPDVALVDVFVSPAEDPDLPSGLAVLRELRRWVPEVKSVVMSGTYDPAIVERAYQEGAVGYVDKNSVSASTVGPLLQQILAGERIFPVAASLVAAERRDHPALAALTQRERDVLRHVSTGADNLRISAHLQISERTVRAHISSLYRKLAADNRTELALTARKLGITPAGG